MKKLPVRLVAIISSHCAGVTSTARLRRFAPALLTRRSSPPNADMASAIAAVDARLRAQVEGEWHDPHTRRFELPHNRVEVFSAGRRHRDVEAIARQRQRRGRSDAIRRAGDKRRPSGFEFRQHFRPFRDSLHDSTAADFSGGPAKTPF